MARQGLPKKYAKMGFKKGWAAYKRSGYRPKTSRSKRRSVRASSSRRRTTKTRPRTKRRNGSMSGFGNILGAGMGKSIMAGAAVGIINRVIPINIAGADYLVAGMIMKEPLLSKLGGITLGRSLAGSLAGGLGGIFAGGNGNGAGVIR